MRALSIREMRAALGRLDELLWEEGEVVITRHGQPVARLLPVRGSRQIPSRWRLRQSMPPITTASEMLIRQDRDER